MAYFPLPQQGALDLPKRCRAPDPIKWRKSGLGIQKVPALKLYKVWGYAEGERVVLDRALTKAAAKRRARAIEARYALN